MGDTAESACHELLLRLAGRMPDRQLWRFRDWLAADALLELSQTLPLVLLRERIGLTSSELSLVDTALRPSGADVGLLSSIRELDEVPAVHYTFSTEPAERIGLGDSLAVMLGAVLRCRPGVGEVRAAWRRRRGERGDAKRVLVVAAEADHPALTGELQRVQRAAGESDPCVEILPADLEPPPYHWAAIEASELLCVGGAEPRRQLVAS